MMCRTCVAIVSISLHCIALYSWCAKSALRLSALRRQWVWTWPTLQCLPAIRADFPIFLQYVRISQYCNMCGFPNNAICVHFPTMLQRFVYGWYKVGRIYLDLRLTTYIPQKKIFLSGINSDYMTMAHRHAKWNEKIAPGIHLWVRLANLDFGQQMFRPKIFHKILVKD